MTFGYKDVLFDAGTRVTLAPVGEIPARGRTKVRPAVVIAALAEPQYGVVSRAQLLTAGISSSAIKRMVSSGWLHRLHPGIYAVVGHAIGQRERWMAAVVLGGPGAMLSHRSAVELWGLLEPIEGPVHVTLGHGRRAPDGVLFHRSRNPGDRAVHDRIPVTSVSQTLLDVSGTLSPGQLRRALDEAQNRMLLRHAELRGLCRRTTGRRGTGTLRTMVEERPLPLSAARSRLEQGFLRFCRERGLPIPAVNVPVGDYEVDCLWPAQRMVVELDSWAHHGNRDSFEADRRRDASLQRAGYRIVRVTHRRLNQDGNELEAEIRDLLRLRRDRTGADGRDPGRGLDQIATSDGV